VTDHQILRIYLSETEQHEGIRLYPKIVEVARELGLSGATVVRGISGYGRHLTVSPSYIEVADASLPVLIEIIETSDQLQNLLARIEPMGIRFATLASLNLVGA
jgi:PII-like signaling protein